MSKSVLKAISRLMAGVTSAILFAIPVKVQQTNAPLVINPKNSCNSLSLYSLLHTRCASLNALQVHTTMMRYLATALTAQRPATHAQTTPTNALVAYSKKAL